MYSSYYANWGFSQPPFSTFPIKSDLESNKLLVGRGPEVDRFMRDIDNGPPILSIEGRFGIGKTSLVNAASYRLYQRHLLNGDAPLFITCIEPFQIDPQQSVEEFVDFVYLKLAETILEKRKELVTVGTDIKFKELEVYLRRLTSRNVTVGATAGVVGVTVGSQIAASSSPVLLRSGFRTVIQGHLKKLFRYDNSGGILCVIDNLELLRRSSTARQWLEQLRDKLFINPHLRWVFCDALGILRSITSSEYFSGLVNKPIRLSELRETDVPLVLASRHEYFRSHHDVPAYLPLRQEDFVTLSQIVGGSLRWVLDLAHEYCSWVGENPGDWPDHRGPRSEEDKALAFNIWLRSFASEVDARVRPKMTKQSWEFFLSRNVLGSRVPHKAHPITGYSETEYRRYVSKLKDLRLLITTRDEDDRRQRNSDLARDGYLLAWHLGQQKKDMSK